MVQGFGITRERAILGYLARHGLLPRPARAIEAMHAISRLAKHERTAASFDRIAAIADSIIEAQPQDYL